MPVEPIVQELAEHPELWNRFQMRTGYGDSPHQVDDIWCRYRSFDDITLKGMAIQEFVGTEHDSVWYDAIDVLPNLRAFVFETCRYFEVERLGGVLITRIPPGGEVKWHTDAGWHANFYSKIALQIKSAPGQAFCFEDGKFECEPGTVYAFHNSVPHRVINPTDQERITLIMCVRLDQRKPPLWQSEAS
jgi:quercetin dioxygenase-like cupin family protein